MVDRKNTLLPPTKDIHVLIPGSCECVSLHGKGLCSCNYTNDFVIRDYPDYPGEFSVITKTL